MKNLFDLANALLIFFLLTAFTFAQTPAATPAADPVLKSLKTHSANDIFTSAEGRFTIALPKDIANFEALKPSKESPKETGGRYTWVVNEGVITIEYSDDPDLVIKTEKDYADLAEGMKTGITDFGAVLSERVIRVGDYRGYEIKFESTEKLKGLSRMIIVGVRKYAVFSLAHPDIPGGSDLLNKAMDSFELVPAKLAAAAPAPVISAAIKKVIEENTPPALPQEPVAQKDRSDAGDANLKGKIKSIINESEALNRTDGRHLSSIEEYDVRGNLLRKTSFDWAHNPYNITVYGYIDGARVSHSKSIFHKYDPPAPMMPLPSPGKPKPVADPRYGLKYEYKYANAKLVEKRVTWSDGTLSWRIVSEYQGALKTSLVYDKNEKLSGKNVYLLNEKGDEIERRDFKNPAQPGADDITWVYTYEAFDEKGNWTRQTMHKVLTEIGGRLTQPYYIYYRTITYYP